jgi:hypothetical protein
MREISSSQFDIYALSLPAGLAFRDDIPRRAWINQEGTVLGAATENVPDRTFGVLIMRRREDDVWMVIRREAGLGSVDVAHALLNGAVVDGAPREPIPSGVARRPFLGDLTGVTPSGIFRSLSRPTHHIAAWVLNQLYLALPQPDQNWARDCQTGNFHTRLWEAHLLACFREQGLRVTQDFPSPDFHICNRSGGEAWVEAVTANPPVPYDHFNAAPAPEPETQRDRLVGIAAVRFAKTIRSKLDKRYDLLSHVVGKPFAIAMADFQSSGSMTWSRGALPTYIYGIEAQVVERDGDRSAVGVEIDFLDGEQRIPAGLFRSDEHAELSAILFSNACSIAKLNRVGVSAGADPKGYRYVRVGEFFDRTPGALESIPFILDIQSAEYRKLWKPYTYEPWAAELEVFHNPFAKYPIPDALLPEASHWRLVDGEVVCRSFYEWSILRSRTLVLDASKPMPTLEQVLGPRKPDE